MKDGEVIEKQRLPSPHPRIKLYLVTYISDGLKVKGYLTEPQTNKSLPGFLYLRGGIKNVGMPRIARIIQFSAEGFVVFAPFYRGNKGGEGQEDFAGNDRNDAINAYFVLHNHPLVKKGEIHLFGFSRGGVMALLTAATVSEVRSVVCWNGVSNMRLTYEERIDLRRMMKRVIGTPTKYPERYDWRTPRNDIKHIQCPVLIIHGQQDEHVSIEHAYQLEANLKGTEKKVDTWYYEEFNHYFPEPFNRDIVVKLTEWMKCQ
ncbi:S9 family peptidase [Alkalihalobacillus sp. BA299]|uniref:alpha/beta hydrolase family protein n=1 Tax=Alkalihalobacillus sp. BA299 TaxID=2815938 RepID=UPI001ADB3E28|nr:prolyl oligopeptidase family serine peptidase [Alkalihalobacillus sp. BA299]